MKTKKDYIDNFDALFMIAFAIIFKALDEIKKEKDTDKSNKLLFGDKERSVK